MAMNIEEIKNEMFVLDYLINKGFRESEAAIIVMQIRCDQKSLSLAMFDLIMENKSKKNKTVDVPLVNIP